MTPENFCYWLQSVFEVADLKKLDEKQTKIIREHLSLVFAHLSPVLTAAKAPKGRVPKFPDLPTPGGFPGRVC